MTVQRDLVYAEQAAGDVGSEVAEAERGPVVTSVSVAGTSWLIELRMRID